MEYICFCFGVLVIVGALIKAYFVRYDTKKWTSTVLLGILVTTFLFILPTVQIKETQGSFTDALYRALSDTLYSFKALGGRQDISQLTGIAFNGFLRYAYIYISYLMFFIAPILSSALVLSFFADMGEKICYYLHFSKKCYIFSDLNSNALSIASGIKENDKHATIVFCNAKSDKKSLAQKSKALGGINLYKSCADFKVSWFHKFYEFYLVSENEDKNITLCAEIIKNNSKVKKGKITVNAFAESGISIDIIEKIKQNNVKLRFVDKVALLCNQIIYTHPLYDIPNDKTAISVMIVGCGKTGIRMLKTAVWCGQIDGYTLKIRVYDNNADKIEREFFSGAPELKNKHEYDIEFIKTDILSPEFESDISASADATYVFIATSDDELNLQTASKLRGIFRRTSGNYDMQPKILTRVRDDAKTENMISNTYLTEQNIYVFGNIDVLFKNTLLFETKFERLSLGVHLAYAEKIDLVGTEDYENNPQYIDCCEDFYNQEYNRRSSMATALHIASKLRSVKVIEHNEFDLTEETAQKFADKLKDNANLLENLAINEHKRWNAFFRSEGYVGTDIETVKKYCRFNSDSHKDKYSKTHPCIGSWEMLDKLSEEFYKLQLSLPEKPKEENDGKEEKPYVVEKQDFKKYDRLIIESIPKIIQFANIGLKEEKKNV